MLHTVTVARHAMATRFEILLHGENPVALRAAAEEALDEIERLEAQLSLYRPTSEIARVNKHAAALPVRVTPPVFRLLEHARRLQAETGGAFDPTVGPLVRCWGFMGGAGEMPAPEAVAEARAKVGMDLVELNEADFTVRFTREGVMLDLGAIGKGYAIDRAAELLVEAGITSAFVHGGTSSSYALGAPPDTGVWKAAISGAPRPDEPVASELAELVPSPESASPGVLAVVPLNHESLGVSAVWGKCFSAEGRRYGHVLDPRSGEPVQRAWLAAVVLPSATETDALSTALLTSGEEGFADIIRLRPEMRALLVLPAPAGEPVRCLAHGIHVQRV